MSIDEKEDIMYDNKSKEYVRYLSDMGISEEDAPK